MNTNLGYWGGGDIGGHDVIDAVGGRDGHGVMGGGGRG